MRQIGSLKDGKLAQRFEDYLLARGIRSRTDETADGFEIWVIDEDQIEQARQEFEEYEASPDEQRYREAADAASEIRKKNEQAIKAARKRLVDVRQRWDQPFHRRAPVTLGLIAISALVALTTSSSIFSLCGKEGSYVTYLFVTQVSRVGDVYRFPIYPMMATLDSGELWRLITPIFIHFTPLHILFNMMWMRDLGSAIEMRKGSFRYLVIVLVIAILSNAMQCIFKGPIFGGMSGVVFGLFGYIWIKSKVAPEEGLFIHPNTVFFVMFFFVICLTGALGPIANWAHAVGLLTGMALAFVPSVLKSQ